jgi:iron-sulfur cluster repair protein YtfE (RIC family)
MGHWGIGGNLVAMLNQITSQRTANQAAEDALDLLIGCHDRIRHFTATANKLAHAQTASAFEIRQAAAGVYRYYSVSLPLHEADEECTLRPRLDAVADARVRHALAAMHDQHLAIDELIERLLPLLQLVERNPAALQETGGEMCAITKALDEVFLAHLQLEEEVIFPVIRGALSEQAQGEMLSEMKGRRKQG